MITTDSAVFCEDYWMLPLMLRYVDLFGTISFDVQSIC